MYRVDLLEVEVTKGSNGNCLTWSCHILSFDFAERIQQFRVIYELIKVLI